MHSCGIDILQKNLLKYIKSIKKLNEKSLKYIKIRELPFNPYCASITGKYIFDLSRFSIFNLYFWKPSDDVDLNLAIKDILIDEIKAIDWTTYYKNQVKKVFDQYCNLFEKNTRIVQNYGEADFVCVLAPKLNFLSGAIGPNAIYYAPEYSDEKIILFLNSDFVTMENIDDGGKIYQTLLHEFGHGFGLAHPHDKLFDSLVIPGVVHGSSGYAGIGGYLQNSLFNTVMTNCTQNYFLPSKRDFETKNSGYAVSLLPLDLVALRWMYEFESIPTEYANKNSACLINPNIDRSVTQIIMGNNREITFGYLTEDISFYLIHQNFTYNNLNPIKYAYNRIIEKEYSFYPIDVFSSISVINLENRGKSFIFIEKESLLVDLIINIGCKECNIYVMDLESEFITVDDCYMSIRSKKSINVKKKDKDSKVNIYFNRNS